VVKKNNFKILSYFFVPLLITMAFKYVSSKPAVDDISMSSQTNEIVKKLKSVKLILTLMSNQFFLTNVILVMALMTKLDKQI
jgi:hypothetical protein